MSVACSINIHTSRIRACVTSLFVLFCTIRAHAHIPLYSILCYQSLYHTPEDWLLVARNNVTAPLVKKEEEEEGRATAVTDSRGHGSAAPALVSASASAPAVATVTEVEVVLFEEVGGDPGSVALVAVC